MPTTTRSIYDRIPALYELRHTHRDADALPVVRTAEEIAEAIPTRAPRDIGERPTEVVRRMLDLECKRARARLTPDEQRKVREFENSIGFDFRRRP